MVLKCGIFQSNLTEKSFYAPVAHLTNKNLSSEICYFWCPFSIELQWECNWEWPLLIPFPVKATALGWRFKLCSVLDSNYWKPEGIFLSVSIVLNNSIIEEKLKDLYSGKDLAWHIGRTWIQLQNWCKYTMSSRKARCWSACFLQMLMSVPVSICKNISKGFGADQRLKKPRERGPEFLGKCTFITVSPSGNTGFPGLNHAGLVLPITADKCLVPQGQLAISCDYCILCWVFRDDLDMYTNSISH